MVGEVIPLEEGILLECDSSPPEEGLPLEVRVFPWQKKTLTSRGSPSILLEERGFPWKERGFPWKERGFSWKVMVLLEEKGFS